jgi:SAM-dependent methyltransferase
VKEAEFDKFADEYYTEHAAGIAFSGEGPEYYSEYKIRDIAIALNQGSQEKDSSLKVLDFGSGIGNSVPYVRTHLTNSRLTCLDLSQRSLDIAEQRFPGLAHYVRFDGKRIPFPNDHFDVAYAMCVFHHIAHVEHIEALRELHRVIRPGGSLFIFEHNPYNPLTVRVVNTCSFDENAHLIRSADMERSLLSAGFSAAATRYRIFFPHKLRFLRPLEAYLSWLPLGGQYSVQSLK